MHERLSKWERSKRHEEKVGEGGNGVLLLVHVMLDCREEVLVESVFFGRGHRRFNFFDVVSVSSTQQQKRG